MTLRRTLFTLYGTAIGMVYVAVLANAWPLSAVLTAIISIAVVAAFSYFGNRLPKAAEMSDRQVLIAIPFFPFALLGGMIAFGFILFFMAVVWPYAAIRAVAAERRFRAMMKTKGRFATLQDLRARLIAGEGTLIEDTGQKGPYRLWWTEDDLFTLGSPASTQEEFISILTGKDHPFNSRCLKDYLDKEAGKALLTSIQPRYAASGELARLFPNVKVAKVIRPLIIPPKKQAEGA
jgi:hypothetical protein